MSRRSSAVLHWRARLDAALDDAAVPRADDLADPAVVERVRLHHLQAICAVSAFTSDGDRIDSEGSFVESPTIGAREVALCALAGVAGSRSPVAADPRPLIDAVIEEPSVLRPSLAKWVRDADRAGLGCLTTRATAWFVDARALATGSRGEPEWQSPAPVAHKVTDRGVHLTAQVDAIRSIGASRHLLTVLAKPGELDDRIARRIALVWVLRGGEIVESVVLGYRSTGERVRFSPDDELLELACSEAALDVGYAQRPSSAPIRTGAHCRFCDIAQDCEPGRAELGATQGLPFPPPRGSASGSDS